MSLPKIFSKPPENSTQDYVHLAEQARGQMVTYQGFEWYVDGPVWLSSAGALLWAEVVGKLLRTRRAYELAEVEVALKAAAERRKEEPLMPLEEYKACLGDMPEQKATVSKEKSVASLKSTDFLQNVSSNMPRARFGMWCQVTEISVSRRNGGNGSRS